MIVVADSSPFIGLLKIGHMDILPRLYGGIVIPPDVAAELSDLRRPAIVLEFMSTPHDWLSIRAPTTLEKIEGLDAGEIAAITLAHELHADLLLIDEIRGRQAAIARHIRTARTAAVLFDAANAGILPNLKVAFEKLIATNFRVPVGALQALLALHNQRMIEKQQKLP